jgi:CHAT domain-containing protein
LASDRYDPRPLAEKIYTAIFRQTSAKQKRTLEEDLRTHLAGHKDKTIMWSLDGVLRYIPMAALHDGRKYLVEDYRNVVFTQQSFLWLTKENQPDWHALGLGLSERRENFDALPGVKTELETIIREPERKTGIINGSIRLNSSFRKQVFFNTVTNGSYPVVHIASHYSFNPAQQEASFLLLGDGRLSFAELKENKNLFGTVDLLTLSACDTATTGNGKEAEGFAYLAQSLGAKSVIASLWKVSDSGTPELMIRFYKRIAENQNITKGEAFRWAQLSLLYGSVSTADDLGSGKHERTEVMKMKTNKSELTPFIKDAKRPLAHPHYWSSFVLIGNWR